jgi:hypothetical protein
MNDAATVLADWQKGFELELLKSFGELFKARHKSLVFGAFGLTKERDIAEALLLNRLIWKGTPPDVEAAAIFAPLSKDSEREDFAQRKLTLPAGSVMVKAFACRSAEAGAKVLGALARNVGASPLIAEIFEEDELAKEAIALCGLEYAFTKISAGSEIKGFYARGGLSIDELPEHELATQLVIAPDWLSPDQHAAVQAELAAYGDHFAQHYSSYNKRKSWTSFALRGFDDDPAFIIKPQEMAKSWKEENSGRLKDEPRWTKAAPHFPQTLGLIDRLGLRFDRIRFMRLRAGNGELSRHADITDREAGLADGFIARLHCPIRTSEAVEFVGWNARGRRIEQSFPERSLFYLDQRKPHAVRNRDPELDRTHLVLDAYADAGLRELIEAAASRAGRW